MKIEFGKSKNFFSKICCLSTILLFFNGSSYAAQSVKKEETLQWWQKTVVYECYVRSFQDTNNDGIGDIRGVISRLDYLKELGVGTVWLTPVYVSPMVDNGYDVADYYNIDPLFGTMEDMENLIKEAEKRNMKIVVDLAVNHCSDQNTWFLESASSRNNPKADWYIWKEPKQGKEPSNWRSNFGGSAWTWNKDRRQYYLHTFAKEMPDLNWANPDVRKQLYAVANYWIKKGVGGFRVDDVIYVKKPVKMTDGKPDGSDGLCEIYKMTANKHGIMDYLCEFKSAVRQGKDIFIVCDAMPVSDNELKDWVGKRGIFDMLFRYNYNDISYTKENMLSQLRNRLNNAQKTTANIGWNPIFFENHDMPRSVSLFFPENSDPMLCAKAIGLLNMTMRGTPYLFQGQEIGMTNVKWNDINMFNDIRAKSDYARAVQEGASHEQAITAVRRTSRDNARTPMQWNTDVNAGFSKGKPWLPVHDNYALQNVEVQSKDPNSVLSWYKKLAALRAEKKALIEGNYEPLLNNDKQIFAYARNMDNQRLTILVNFSEQDASFDPNLLKGSSMLLSSYGNQGKIGFLRPYEAVMYEN